MGNEEIFSKVGQIMTKLEQNKQLQKLALENGLDVKNTIQLTEETTNNIAVAVVALSLAKEANDPDYSALVRAGLSHRKIKTDVINKYKNQANQMIAAYKNQLRNPDPME